MKKKGQATIFIIIGIVLLIGLGVFLLMRMSHVNVPVTVTSKVRPVKDYVESCISQVAKQGLEIQGAHGGYITYPDAIKYNAHAYLKQDILGSIQNPYWYYDGINNTPTLELANGQLKDYITTNVMSCFSNFSAFKDYNVTPVNQAPVITVTYADDNTIITADYPLVVTDLNTGDVDKELTEFQSFVPIRFKKVFEIARAIQDSQDSSNFLERKTIDLIAIAPEDEIPYTGMALRCGSMVWSKQKIKERLTGLIRFNFPYIKFSNLPYDKSKYVNVPDKPSTFENSYYYQHYIWDINAPPDNDIRATVYFDDSFPFVLYANPSKGDRLSSNSINGMQMLSFLCVNIWHFTYDIKYPVVIRIKDLSGAGEQYTFEYATQVSINHNTPDHNITGHITTEPVTSGDETEYCKTDSSDKTINVIARDNDTGIEVQNANITFVCGFMSCNLGLTRPAPNLGNLPALSAKAPYCVNAVLKADAQNYFEGTRFGDVTTEVEGSTYYVDMSSAREFNTFYIVKHALDDNGNVSQLEAPLSADETAAISITVNDRPEISYFLAYPIPFTEANEITPLKLFASQNETYHITIYVNKGENMVAAYEGDWTPDLTQLNAASKIKFHVIQPSAGDDEKTYLFMQGLPSYSKKAPAPELIP